MGARSSLKLPAKVVEAKPARVTPSIPASSSKSSAPTATASIVESANTQHIAASERSRKHETAADCQSRKTISRLLYAQPHWVVWDLPEQSILRMRAQTYDKHVGKSDEELLNVLRRNYIVGAAADWFQQAEGSFADIPSAWSFVNRVLEENPAEVDKVAKGRHPDAVLQSRFCGVTGKEAFRPDCYVAPLIRDTHCVCVVIKAAVGTERGYRIHTAFPTSQDPRKWWRGDMQVPDGFYRLCAHSYQGSHEEFASESEWMANAVGSLRGNQKQIVLKFLDEMLGRPSSDAEIERVWQNTSADYSFSPGGHRIFLTKIRDMIRMVLTDAFW